MTGYVRKDTTNNIADGNVINAADLDNEFDGVVAAFNASTGHTHDGTAAEGAPITKIGPSQDVVASSTALSPKTTNTVDIGTSSLKFKDFYLSGAASIAGQITSTVSTGTAPLVIASTTKVSNLNADLLDGGDWAAPGSIGATTANAGAFTTLSASSTVTLSGGTANGVAYLNGSKVVTTGSALTFDGTRFFVGTTAVTTSSTQSGEVYSTGALGFLFTNTTAANYPLSVKNEGTSGTRNLINFYEGTAGGNARANLSLDGSNNFSITSANSTVFNASGSEGMRLTSTGLGIGTSSPANKLVVSNAGAAGFEFDPANTILQTYNRSTSAYVSMNLYASQLRLYTGSSPTLNATLDSSGNLGLGVTPSAWGSNPRAFELKTAGHGLATLGAGDIALTQNAYFDNTNFKYAATTGVASSMYRQLDGSHRWYYAASGTAGNTITFTQAMTLDASGNLGVGTTTPFSGAITIARGSGVQASVEIAGNGTTAGSTSLSLIQATDSTAYVYNRANTALIFGTNNTERARITSGGDLLVGTTSTSLENSRSFSWIGASGGLFRVNHSTTNGSGDGYMEFGYNATKIGSITQDGTTAVLYNTTSDQRLKENIADADSASDLIDAIQVRKFDWKSDGSHQRYGMVAQELAQVAPEAVHQPADPEEMMAVDYSKLVPMLLKEIQSLRARVAALEAK